MSVEQKEREPLSRTQQLQKRRILRRQKRLRFFFRLLTAVFIVTAIVLGAVKLIPALLHKGSIDNTARFAEIQEEIAGLDWVAPDLLPVNEYSRPGTALTEVNAIVIHYVGNPGTTAAQNRSYYNNLAETHETCASSNFLIGLEGEIVQCVPVNEVAYCSNWRNNDSISIECCHPDDTGKFNGVTYDSLVRLTAWLLNEYGLTSADVIRHYDITGKVCPKYFVDHPDAWDAFKAEVQTVLDALLEEQKT